MTKHNGYRAFLNRHGLRLRQDNIKQGSYAQKSYSDINQCRATIEVLHRRDGFTITVSGKGQWLNFFIREARVIKSKLMQYKTTKIIHVPEGTQIDKV